MKCKTSAHGDFSSHYLRSHSKSYNVPSSSTLTYEGLFNENYFLMNNRETNSYYNLEISNASILSPITNKREYFLGVLLKSKYDGIGLREPIDIGLSIDISGSMYGESIAYTKKSVIKFVENLNEKDNICINTFNDESNLIIPFQKKNDLNNLENIINSLEADGLTYIYEGLLGIYTELKKFYDKGNKAKRVIILTDMEYEHNEKFIQLLKKKYI